jgi:redox-sensitive bicupin YhaK (pirin superfamily)
LEDARLSGFHGILLLPEGGVEWFKAGRGAWHRGGAGDLGRTPGFQLWIALPPDRELEPAESIYQAPQDIRRIGPASALLGRLGAVSSSLPTPSPMNYLPSPTPESRRVLALSAAGRSQRLLDCTQ